MTKKKNHKETPPGCRACRWTGRVETFVLVNGEMVPAMAYCVCPRGSWREQLSRKREAEVSI